MFRLIGSALLLSLGTAAMAAASSTPLHEGWKLESACKLTASGEAISTSTFRPAQWTTISVPSTVLAGQVAAANFPRPLLRN